MDNLLLTMLKLDCNTYLTKEQSKVFHDYIQKLLSDNEVLKAQVKQLQQTIMQCAELVNVDGGTAMDWLVDNHQNLLEQAKWEL